MNKYGFWLTLPLFLILFFRLKGSKKIKRITMQSNTQGNIQQKPNELSFLLIEKKLSKKGFPRHKYETYFAWLERIGYHFNNKETKKTLQTLILLHNKNRFNRSKLKKNEQKIFHSGIKNIKDINVLLSLQ